MNAFLNCLALACGIGSIGWAARCTTVAEAGVIREYGNYVAVVEKDMSRRFNARELSWVPLPALKDAESRLASRKLVRRNVSDAALNQRIAEQNGTVIHWIGAIRIRRATLADLQSVLEDHGHYDRIYRPIVFESRTEKSAEGPHAGCDVLLGLRNEFRFASVFPQRYAFRVKARFDHSSRDVLDAPALRMHLSAADIRESDSGVPGRADYLEQYHDHGIMWALNAYWRARQSGLDLYLEFETITLARSVQAFACKIGFVPVPKSVISSVMEAVPAESVTVVLEGTRAECERRARMSTRDIMSQ